MPLTAELRRTEIAKFHNLVRGAQGKYGCKNLRVTRCIRRMAGSSHLRLRSLRKLGRYRLAATGGGIVESFTAVAMSLRLSQRRAQTVRTQRKALLAPRAAGGSDATTGWARFPTPDLH
jgi:hypothetical protein